VEYEVKEEIKEKANTKEVDIDTSKVIDVESRPVNNPKAQQVTMGGPDF
jgi:hypothetical protein